MYGTTKRTIELKGNLIGGGVMHSGILTKILCQKIANTQ